MDSLRKSKSIVLDRTPGEFQRGHRHRSDGWQSSWHLNSLSAGELFVNVCAHINHQWIYQVYSSGENCIPKFDGE